MTQAPDSFVGRSTVPASGAAQQCPSDVPPNPVASQIAFFLLLVIVAARPLVSETYESALVSMAQPLRLPAGPGPVLTLTFGGLILLAGVLAFSGRGHGRPRIAPGGLALGLVLVVIGASLSLQVASNRRLALNAASDWVLTAVAGILLIRVMRRPWQVRLLLAVLTASGAAFAAQCLVQRFVEFPETIAEYEADREHFWAAQNISLDDPAVILYERRLYAMETGGYFPHPNVAASLLLLAVGAALALGLGKFRTGPSPEGDRPFRILFGGAMVVLAAGLAACLPLTGSRGAEVAGLVAGLGMGAWAALVRRSRLSAGARLGLGWLAVTAVALGVVLYARSQPAYTSMGVRWDYWRNTSRLLRDYFWTGVGSENFGRFYLRYKPITSPEEIRDPHNFLLAAFGQWGATGVAGLIVMALGTSVHLVRRARAPGPSGPVPHPSGADPGSPLLWMAGLGLGVFCLRACSLWGHSPAFLAYSLGLPLMVWCIAFLAATVESNRLTLSDGPLAPATACVLVAAVLAFLLHAMIDVPMFYPGTAATFFAVLGAAVVARRLVDEPDSGQVFPSAGSRRPAAAALVPVAFAIGWVVHLTCVWLPAAKAQWHLSAARTAPGLLRIERLASAMQPYERADRADPMDPTPSTEAADMILDYLIATQGGPPDDTAEPWLERAVAFANRAARRDPCEVGIRRTLATAYSLRADAFESLVDARAAVGAAMKAVELYPESTRDHAMLGDALALVSRLELGPARTEALAAAVEHYEMALRLDASRPGGLEVRRWPEAVRTALRKRVEELRAAMTQPATRPAGPPATVPAETQPQRG